LTSLKGAPDHVGRWFSCRDNPLNSLEGAPAHVDRMFYVSFLDDLPLLRLLEYDQFSLRDAPDLVQDIMNKYAGTGKKGMLGAAVELTKAGFKANARW
jgi:hypothetical protein